MREATSQQNTQKRHEKAIRMSKFPSRGCSKAPGFVVLCLAAIGLALSPIEARGDLLDKAKGAQQLGATKAASTL